MEDVFVNLPSTESLVQLLDEILANLNAQESRLFLVLSDEEVVLSDEEVVLSDEVAGGAYLQQIQRSETLKGALAERKRLEIERDPRDLAGKVKNLDRLLDRLYAEDENILEHSRGLRNLVLPMIAWLILMILFYIWVRGNEIVFSYSIDVYSLLYTKLVKADASFAKYTKVQLHEYLMTYKGEYPDLNRLLETEHMTLSYAYSRYGTLANTWKLLEPYFRNQLQRNILKNVISGFMKAQLGINLEKILPVTALGAAAAVASIPIVQRVFINLLYPGFDFVFVTPMRIIYYSFPYDCKEYRAVNRFVDATPRLADIVEVRAIEDGVRAIEDRPRPRARGASPGRRLAGGVFGGGCLRSMVSTTFMLRIFFVLVIVMAAGSLGHHNLYTLLKLTSSLSEDEVSRNYQYHFFKSFGDVTECVRQFLLVVLPSGPPNFYDPNYVDYILPLERRAEAWIKKNFEVPLPVLIALWFATFLFNRNPEVIKTIEPYVESVKMSDVPSFLFKNPPDWMSAGAFTWKLTEGARGVYTLRKTNRKGEVQDLVGSLEEIRNVLLQFNTKVRALTNE